MSVPCKSSSMRMPYTVPDAPEMPMISRRGEFFVILSPFDAIPRIVVQAYQAASVGWVERKRNPPSAFPSRQLGDEFGWAPPVLRGFIGQQRGQQYIHGVRRECARQR